MSALWWVVLALGVLPATDRSPAPPAHHNAVKVPAGTVAPLFGLDPGQTRLPVESFWLDAVPVTNAQFLAFTRAQPQWAHGKPPRMLADATYLRHWKRGAPPAALANAPVVHVSWYAAGAYCSWRNGRLPTTLEWEYAGAASATVADASQDPVFVNQILGWYAARGNAMQNNVAVGKSKPNLYGIHDLHGLVWEWTGDFNSVFVTGDNRQDGDKVKNLFCGAGSTGAARREDYAAFMRYAMRSSLSANFSTANLGFRCAYDAPPAEAP